MDTSSPQVLVVLGCRVRDTGPSEALVRRLSVAFEVHRTLPHLPIIMSGGKQWHGVSEAEVMKSWWNARLQKEDSSSPFGAVRAELLCENRSTTTRENALFVARLCADMGYQRVALVTCDFHMGRARWLFTRRGLLVNPHPARSASSLSRRFRLALREAASTWLERLRGPGV